VVPAGRRGAGVAGPPGPRGACGHVGRRGSLLLRVRAEYESTWPTPTFLFRKLIFAFVFFVYRACSGVGECNVRGHCECPLQYTGVDCAEGAPGAASTAAAAAAAVTPDGQHVPAHNLDDAQGAQLPCPTLWGRCRRGEATSPRIYIYTFQDPAMVWNDTTDVDFGRVATCPLRTHKLHPTGPRRCLQYRHPTTPWFG